MSYPDFSTFPLEHLKELALFYGLKLPQIYYLSKHQLAIEIFKYYSWFN